MAGKTVVLMVVWMVETLVVLMVETLVAYLVALLAEWWASLMAGKSVDELVFHLVVSMERVMDYRMAVKLAL